MNTKRFTIATDLVYKCPISLATVKARYILYLISGEKVPECITMGTRNARQLVKEICNISLI
ncbi:MAG TPA: hypothetical protein PKN32_12975 [Bacteroidales bacterium]|nr:hypothetical protein [Bacteroidales bacterium]